MASRREFLQMGVAALTLPISAHAALSTAPSLLDSEPMATPLYKIVFDERFSSSRAFAEEAERLGTSVHGITGDMTDLWYHDLYARWKKGPAAIAGLTAHGPIFCLERLAWDQRMRVIFRADHRYRADGSIEHALSGPATMLRQAAALSSEPDWANRMASLVTHCPANRSQSSQSNVIGPTVKHADDPEHLISWVIAPIHRA
ncbi:MAG TPA: hypothetical protein VEJ46_10945 [Candidatus Acidoferrum sp.]|nr:hypothetical protein [Candidatus Acidoferrum sp.]